ncbi:hypothetical protein GCM10008929_00920 [Alkalibacterium psychrotolerans]
MFRNNNRLVKQHSSAEWSILGGSLLLSFLLGAAAFSFVSSRKSLKADDLLKKVKKEFLKEGPIDGSWIELTKVPWKKYAYETDVYYGGVSRYEENKLIQYEYIVDAYTGSLIDLYKV